MKACFADTAYFIALLNPDDVAHSLAVEQSKTEDRMIVTTSAVLTELANQFAKPPNRTMFVNFVGRLQANSSFRAVHVDQRLFELGLTLYRERPDKSWSLTDCISFVLMGEMQMAEALTTDHHFEQAGFTVLLK